MSNKVLTFTTDFGSSDSYVAAMKGVALGIAPDLTLVDVTHDVPSHDIVHGAFVLGSVYRYFPAHTVHVAVVDPGVGTSRKAVTLVTPFGSFCAPDNGLLSYVLNDHHAKDRTSFESKEFGTPVRVPVPDGCEAFEISNPAYRLEPVSDTFHGRDIFTPAGTHLASGLKPERLGKPLNDLTILNLFTLELSKDCVVGKVIHVDRFGNVVTNIPASQLPQGDVVVEIADTKIHGLSTTFADAEGLLALIGSHGYLEIAENLGSAARRLDIGVGDTVVAHVR
ncbi:MAG: SAM-dependent chlorinase/fluorinase [Dehalococcoidia bacterium]|nr:SAM-dependent chlorinase/fluorinase [Dehalococcoidia bacterium]